MEDMAMRLEQGKVDLLCCYEHPALSMQLNPPGRRPRPRPLCAGRGRPGGTADHLRRRPVDGTHPGRPA
ncbi:hypothetical protein CNMCM8686_000726 [Aspergillus fumigatus]|nr:hypothetical protein CNMCM8686_000726 [Aspergillus fumigatus]